VLPEHILGPSRRGRKIAIITDSADSSKLVEACKDADLIVHESSFGSDVPRADAVMKGHCTAQMAGEFAKRVNTSTLFLTHFSGRYQEHEIQRLAREARQACPDVNVATAEDLMCIRIARYPFGAEEEKEEGENDDDAGADKKSSSKSTSSKSSSSKSKAATSKKKKAT
jgi:ribonuclease BN (tRNA processing enzyme)